MEMGFLIMDHLETTTTNSLKFKKDSKFFDKYYSHLATSRRSTIYKIKFVAYSMFKRTMDFILALIGLIIASPIMLLVALAIKIESKGPVIFTQIRTGKYGKPFKLYKFRSMAIDNDVHDFSKSDQHTVVGSFIRKTSLDELPQLINILKGNMSFIGPRPWITDYYDNMNEQQRHRCDVLPGITGLAQAKGRNNISIFDKIKYDLAYIDEYSLYSDVKVIILTIATVLSKKGADAGKSTIQNELEDLKKANNK